LSEHDQYTPIRVAAARRGAWLMRNNSGAGKLASGNFVRFGLGNESERINEVCKSSDLIGIEPVVITADMVGRTIGRFVAREVKPPGWRYTGTKREAAQKAFIDKINELGGNAQFTTGDTYP